MSPRRFVRVWDDSIAKSILGKMFPGKLLLKRQSTIDYDDYTVVLYVEIHERMVYESIHSSNPYIDRHVLEGFLALMRLSMIETFGYKQSKFACAWQDS